MELPNARERKALQNLRYSEWEYAGNLYPAGAGTIAKMIDRGWIEQLPDSASGLKRFRITAAGIAALDAASPPRPRGKPKLKMLKPALRALDTRTAKPAK